jgi:hypothetical protein
MKLEDWHRWWKQTGARELRQLLMDECDPLHARGVPEAADEYDGYLGPLAARLREGASADVIADYLTEVERERNQMLASRLRAWYDEATAEAE